MPRVVLKRVLQLSYLFGLGVYIYFLRRYWKEAFEVQPMVPIPLLLQILGTRQHDIAESFQQKWQMLDILGPAKEGDCNLQVAAIDALTTAVMLNKTSVANQIIDALPAFDLEELGTCTTTDVLVEHVLGGLLSTLDLSTVENDHGGIKLNTSQTSVLTSYAAQLTTQAISRLGDDSTVYASSLEIKRAMEIIGNQISPLLRENFPFEQQCSISDAADSASKLASLYCDYSTNRPAGVFVTESSNQSWALFDHVIRPRHVPADLGKAFKYAFMIWKYSPLTLYQVQRWEPEGVQQLWRFNRQGHPLKLA